VPVAVSAVLNRAGGKENAAAARIFCPLVLYGLMARLWIVKFMFQPGVESSVRQARESLHQITL